MQAPRVTVSTELVSWRVPLQLAVLLPAMKALVVPVNFPRKVAGQPDLENVMSLVPWPLPGLIVIVTPVRTLLAPHVTLQMEEVVGAALIVMEMTSPASGLLAVPLPLVKLNNVGKKVAPVDGIVIDTVGGVVVVALVQPPSFEATL